MRTFKTQARHGVTYFDKGNSPIVTEYLPGDFILVHNRKNFYSKVIRFGQALRIRGADRKYCYWNHAALIVSDHGDMVEAEARGVVRSHITDYHESEYALVNVAMSKEDMQELLQFANYMVGEKYGFLTIVSIGINLLFGGDLVFSMQNQSICSGLVARAQERVGALFSRDPSHIMPADLAKYYQVEIPDAN